METTSTEDGSVSATPDPDREPDAEKSRALGYIGPLTCGAHHQKHHWLIVQGTHSHPTGASSVH